MRFTRKLIPTTREIPTDISSICHILMIRAGYVRQLATGLYIFLPLGWRVINKINQIIREEMECIGAQELSMPILHPADIWQQTGRWDSIGEEMFRLKDRTGRDMCLGMTHEEIITWLASRELKSYRDLPQVWYQIQTKLRDEARPRSGVLRTREFIMKDSYSFDMDEEGLDKNYQLHIKAYHKIFTRCGLKFYQVESDPGMMGGSTAHEFMSPTLAGEDEIIICNSCGYIANIEVAVSQNSLTNGNICEFKEIYTSQKKTTRIKEGNLCIKCNKLLRIEKAIEIGNIFKLGTKYSIPLNAVFSDKNGKERPIIMGSYGIGTARIAAAVIEQSHDKDGIIWTKGISPYDFQIIPLNINNTRIIEIAEFLYNELPTIYNSHTGQHFDVLIDDRNESPGVKFKDADLIGIPFHIIIGEKTLRDNQIELKNRKTKEVKKIDIKYVIKDILKIYYDTI